MTLWILLMMPSRSMKSAGVGTCALDRQESAGKEVLPMAANEALRYNERTVAERFNSRLKEEFGGKKCRVRGYEKVKLHLMFGVLALFADQLIKTCRVRASNGKQERKQRRPICPVDKTLPHMASEERRIKNL